MSNLLENYLSKRGTAKEVSKKNIAALGGPVITISRQVGCNAVMLAEQIAARLNSVKSDNKWKVISKEIFQESAKELNMDPNQIIKTVHQSEKYAFGEMLKAFSNKKYVSERKIGKTIKGVILNIATDGYSIMVGRAVHIIAKDIKKALHVRLVAPLEFRVNSIMKYNHLNREEALAYIKKTDKERKAYRKALLKDDLQNTLFDITLNRSVFTDEELVEIIVHAAVKKNIFQKE